MAIVLFYEITSIRTHLHSHLYGLRLVFKNDTLAAEDPKQQSCRTICSLETWSLWDYIVCFNVQPGGMQFGTTRFGFSSPTYPIFDLTLWGPTVLRRQTWIQLTHLPVYWGLTVYWPTIWEPTIWGPTVSRHQIWIQLTHYPVLLRSIIWDPPSPSFVLELSRLYFTKYCLDKGLEGDGIFFANTHFHSFICCQRGKNECQRRSTLLKIRTARSTCRKRDELMTKELSACSVRLRT